MEQGQHRAVRAAYQELKTPDAAGLEVLFRPCLLLLAGDRPAAVADSRSIKQQTHVIPPFRSAFYRHLLTHQCAGGDRRRIARIGRRFTMGPQRSSFLHRLDASGRRRSHNSPRSLSGLPERSLLRYAALGLELGSALPYGRRCPLAPLDPFAARVTRIGERWHFQAQCLDSRCGGNRRKIALGIVR